MEARETIFKILTLYILTSCMFLGIIFYGWYGQGKIAILESLAAILRGNAHTLASSLYEKLQTQTDDLQNLFRESSEEFQIPFMIMTHQGEVVFSSSYQNQEEVRKIFHTPRESLNFWKKDMIVMGDTMYLVTQHLGGKRFWLLLNQRLLGNENIASIQDLHKNFRHFEGGFFLVLFSNGIKAEIHNLLGLMFGVSLLALVVISVIAYFLVLFSLKPLRSKVQSLNMFIKDSTHEIKTPLSAILMSVERINPKELTPQSYKKFERIRFAAQTLEQIYQDLLFYNFDEAKELKLEMIEMSQLIQERISYFQPFFKKKKIEILVAIELERDEKSLLKANKIRIARAIDNLLDNALKYTAEGGNVWVNLQKNRLSIQDNGCGIKKENLGKIFERYYRSNSNQGGFGIGLTLVKQICQIYHIKISCKSQEGEGSEFILNW